MNEAFEADQLHGQPVTPPAAVPEQGEFERVMSEYKGCLDYPDYEQSSERVFSLRLLLKDLTAAHNRDMSEARKRIAELEAQRAPAPGDPVEKAIKGAIWTNGGNGEYDTPVMNDHNATLLKIRTAYRAERARMMAEAPKVVKPIECDALDFVGEHYTYEACPECGEELQKGYMGGGWQFCPICGTRLDWSDSAQGEIVKPYDFTEGLKGDGLEDDA